MLLIPRKEIPSVDAIADDDQALLGHLWLTVRNVARELGLEQGYRLVVNCGREAGQEVDHLHIHILGGRPMTWPPG